jgi:hypothetical protein
VSALFLIVLKNSEYRLDPISAAGAFPERGCRSLVIHARLNGDRSESICGDNPASIEDVVGISADLQ